MREIRTSGSMSPGAPGWKRSKVGLLRHRQTKGAATHRPNLNHRATSRLYQKPVSKPAGMNMRANQGKRARRTKSTRPLGRSLSNRDQLPLQLPLMHLLEQQSLLALHASLLPAQVTH